MCNTYSIPFDRKLSMSRSSIFSPVGSSFGPKQPRSCSGARDVAVEVEVEVEIEGLAESSVSRHQNLELHLAFKSGKVGSAPVVFLRCCIMMYQ